MQPDARYNTQTFGRSGKSVSCKFGETRRKGSRRGASRSAGVGRLHETEGLAQRGEGVGAICNSHCRKPAFGPSPLLRECSSKFAYLRGCVSSLTRLIKASPCCGRVPARAWPPLVREGEGNDSVLLQGHTDADSCGLLIFALGTVKWRLRGHRFNARFRVRAMAFAV